MASWSERKPARVIAQSETSPLKTHGSAEVSSSSSGSRSGLKPVNSRMRRETCGIGLIAELDKIRVDFAMTIFASIRLLNHPASGAHYSLAICNDCRMTKLANLDRTAHKNLRVQDEQAFGACKDTAMCAVVLNELPRLVIEYPLAFTKHAETGQYVCVALFGVDPDRNLFWQDERWNSATVPLN